MSYFISLVLLAVAISLDSFSTGLAYGLRKIRIPIKSILIIALCTAISLIIAMMVGQLISGVLTPIVANRIGGAILILIGIWIIYQFFKTDKEQLKSPTEKLVLNWEIKSLGIVIHILKKPTRADVDGSGTINGVEAILLGAALSLDAFGAGVGAAMLGFSPWILAISAALMSGIFLSSGLYIGRLFSKKSWLQNIAFMPGLILVFIGLLKM